MTDKTGLRAHKDALKSKKIELQKLNAKFEGGTLQDFERDCMDILSLDIAARRQELKGFI